MANDLIPYYRPGEDLTCYTTAAVTGKKCVQITAAKTNLGEGLASSAADDGYHVGHPNASGAPGAGKRCVGVAKYDAGSGKFVGVARAGVLPVTAGAAITAGQEVEVNAAGAVIPLAAGIAVGMALNDCQNGADAEILWYS